ncbi:protein-L-isoaspartate O-methyltransferase [Methylocapsa sp. S129]|uniref:protein-L-isoaspartate O-methyltransferase family protein n=1 Tax=Methylocapsa sp. S129 TaxID=1641869 RepID=UPI001FEDDE81|nr:protein-L-isoaspartate O-methyltransferase [Methylocapsa sp. S129]
MQRRNFLAGTAGLLVGALASRLAMADDAPAPAAAAPAAPATPVAPAAPAAPATPPAKVLPTPFTFDLAPPTDSREKFVAWGVAQREEDPKYLGERFDRFGALVRNEDLWDDRNKNAFLLTPREKFVRAPNLPRAYEHAFLDIGFGVTISGPHIVGRMTNTIDVKKGEKVLEIGTGSGYQSAYLSHLTDKVFTIEIIKPLAERTRATYDELIAAGYSEFKAISSKNADGYYGWEDAGPFDKIIVTCGIDHIPPPLLQQLKPNGIMVIPVGPPGAQRVLKVVKTQGADGSITVARSDIYGGKIVPFVPFTKLEGDAIKGTHNN